MGASSICCFKPVVQHRSECERGKGIRYKPKLVRTHALEQRGPQIVVEIFDRGAFGDWRDTRLFPNTRDFVILSSWLMTLASILLARTSVISAYTGTSPFSYKALGTTWKYHGGVL